jgi:anti-anti-sigma factor
MNNPADRPPPPEPELPREHRILATYDKFGQTLVATVASSTLSGPDAQDLTEEIQRWLNDPSADTPTLHIVFDLQNVQYMDSGCIGVMVELLNSIQQSGGRIALVNAGHNVEYLFKLTRLDRLFPVCRDVMKAIAVVERAA